MFLLRGFIKFDFVDLRAGVLATLMSNPALL